MERNYVLVAGQLIDPFDSATGWVNYNSTGTFSLSESADFVKTGSKSLLFNQANAGGSYSVSYRKDLAAAVNLSSVDYFYMWVYSPNGLTSGANTVSIFIATAFPFTSYCNATLGAVNTGTIKKGWNLWQFKKANFSITGGFDWSSCGTIMIKWNTASVADSIYIDGLYVGYNSRPKIVMTMDDGHGSQKAATEYANSLSIPTSLYVIKDQSSDTETYPGYLSASELQALYSAGNDVCLHHQTNLTTVSVPVAMGYLSEAMSWLDGLGMSRASKHLSWPNGAFSDGLISGVQGLGILSAPSIRGVGISSYNLENHALGVANRYNINRMPLSGTTLAAAKAAVDDCILRGNTFMPYVHTIGTALEWATADWNALCDYIATKRDAGLVDVVTISQYITGLDHEPPVSTGISFGPWALFDNSMPALSLASTAPGSLIEVQEWSKPNVTKRQIDGVR